LKISDDRPDRPSDLDIAVYVAGWFVLRLCLLGLLGSFTLREQVWRGAIWVVLD
jgi:hypothetical protein